MCCAGVCRYMSTGYILDICMYVCISRHSYITAGERKDGDICIKDSERIVVLVGGWLAGPLNRVG